MSNAVGDFAKVMGGAPGSLMIKNTFKSADMLAKFFTHTETSTDILEYINEGGLETGLAQIELGDFRSLAGFNFYDETGNLKPMKAIVAAMGKGFGKGADGLENFYQWREQVFRLGAFMYFKDKVLNNPKGLPANGDYRFSVPREIKSIKTVNGRAFKMANDMVGAYDDTTPATQFMSKNLKPFFRYRETLWKSYFRGMKNSFYHDPDVVVAAGLSWKERYMRTSKIGASAIWKIGKFIVLTNAVELALHLANRLIRPEEDDQVPDYIREKSHITLGKWNGKVWYIANMGSLREALAIVGFSDLYNDFYEVFTGKMNYQEKLKEMVMGPIDELTSGILPLAAPIFELRTGKKMFNNQNIRDDWQYIADFFEMGQIYKEIAGKPTMDGAFNWNLSMVKSVTANETYMWDVFTMKDEYLASIGKPSPDFGISKQPKSMALYNFRTAVRLNDKDAAIKYLKEYWTYGGDLKSIESSARGLHPLNGMTKEDKSAFIAQLEGHEAEVYGKGITYYNQYAKDIQDIAKRNWSSLPKK